MPIVYEKLLALKIPEVVQTYTEKDCMLYALGVGLGLDPMDEQQLAFVYEKNLKALPTMAAVIGYPGLVGEGARYRHRLGQSRRRRIRPHSASAAHDARHDPQPHPRARCRRQRPGQGRGDLCRTQPSKTRRPANSIATIVQTTFCRNDGGFGGPPREQRPVHTDPGAHTGSRLRSADPAGGGVDLSPERRPQSAACGPRGCAAPPAFRARSCMGSRPSASPAMPFSRPSAATIRRGFVRSRGGFPRRCFRAKRSAPRFGDDGGVVSFRVRVVERDVVALNNGRAEIRAAS